jgi:hypothetical protein
MNASQDPAKTLAAKCGCEEVERDSNGDGSPMVTTSVPKTLTNRFPVRVAAEKKQKLRTPTATRFPIATVKCPKTMQRLWQPNVAVEKK